MKSFKFLKILLLISTVYILSGCGDDKRTKAYKKCLKGLAQYQQPEKSAFGQGFMGTCMQMQGFKYKVQF
tara:strand:- start:511 stop:720 length:210 start_codon:yes stop_codon:yes gene_type:complete